MAVFESVQPIDNNETPKKPSIYDLCPLTRPRDVRLLRLDRASNPDAPLKGALVVVRLDEVAQSESFVALSYTWEPPLAGMKIPDGIIYLEKQPLPITGNLDCALRRIRTREDRLIWVDMICIDQAHTDEKSRQVMLMYDIFKAASCVIAWLGEDPDRDAEYAIELVGSLEGRAIDDQLTHIKSLTKSFASRRYFHRRWIVQELSAALRNDSERVEIMYGSQITTWDMFKQSLSLIATSQPHVSNFLAACDPHEFALSYLGGMEGSAVIQQLQDTQDLDCQDERDRIYALSNLWQGLSIQVDYSLSCAEVYIHFILALFSRTPHGDAGALAVEIMAMAAFQHASVSAKDRLITLSSWMPDWRFSLPSSSWKSLSSGGLTRKDRLEGLDGRHALTIVLMVYAVVYDARSETLVDVVTSDGDSSTVTGLEGRSGQFFQEGDILCRPKMDSDFNVNPNAVSVILRPHVAYNDVFALVGRWKRSSLATSLVGVAKRVVVI